MSPTRTLPNTTIINTPMMSSESKKETICPRTTYCIITENCGIVPTGVTLALGSKLPATETNSAISRSISAEL